MEVIKKGIIGTGIFSGESNQFDFCSYIIFLSVSNMQEFDGYTLFTPFSVDEEVVTTILMNND